MKKQEMMTSLYFKHIFFY